MRIISACPVAPRGILARIAYRKPPAEADRATAQDRHRRITQYQKLRAEGCCEATALTTLNLSRATYYRWRADLARGGLHALAPKSRRPHHTRPRQWTRQDESRVLQMRRDNPCWGRATIRAALAREYHGFTPSTATVGRILNHAIARKRIRPCAPYTLKKAKPGKAKRTFAGRHAQRWCYHRWQQAMRAMRLGVAVQVDSMHLAYNTGTTFKAFHAICPASRIASGQVYTRATAHNARRFLTELIAQLPFPLHSIQVDGGSEFRGEFETACAELSIGMKVLPPHSPKYNGRVERANRTLRAEFYNRYSGETTTAALNIALGKYLHHYNRRRPHHALDLNTPFEYACKLMQAHETESQMC